ncbi:Uncharacterized conserved protein YgbK, DUF1537 family [Arthrobacter sp. ov407]|uniref:3-oxo-tetronate kinase n=1 Tax=Arthrobacter sp. ov407 TaxID=1761748 RepID=UPI00087F73CF|nr:3-oxo-tetronate kinase [Arthrobacter sp. ov407]SDL97809.1 Uncharacterized conserved protein YgbK, DUF1537 family [Arthrobacter sp. ov407]
MPLLGCIADDFTGATDLATNLVSRGLRTMVVFGHQAATEEMRDADAVVVALKTRTAPVEAATSSSLKALDFLEELGAEKIYVKYCSTFDSTAEGNIGPVIDAVLAQLEEDTTVVVPSFPAGGRTVRDGKLYVDGQLLHESSMRHHPLTPMLDSSVERLLRPQSSNTVAHVPLDQVRRGADDLARTIKATRMKETDKAATLVVIDAVDESDLQIIAAATAGLKVITGGSGLALGLSNGEDTPASAEVRALPSADGFRAVLSGSASATTRAQVAHGRAKLPSLKLDLSELRERFEETTSQIAAWASGKWAEDPIRPILIYSVDSLEDIHSSDTSPDEQPASEVVEGALAEIARKLVQLGARQLIIAGGETSGQVVTTLQIPSLTIGPAIAAGVAWGAGATADETGLLLALKSGNFAEEDMFTAAWEKLV